MPRTAGDVGFPTDQRWPPDGKHLCRCMRAERWTSPFKKTPAVRLTWATPDGLYTFTDAVFVTTKTLERLNLVAQRVARMPKDYTIPDDAREAAGEFARYIIAHAVGYDALVTVASTEQSFIYEKGPKIGQKGSRKIHQVTFAGYEKPEINDLPDQPPGYMEDAPMGPEGPEAPPDPDDIPF